MPHLVRSACLTDYVEIARSVGLDPFRMVAAAGLPASCLHEHDLRISADVVRGLLEASALAAGRDDFGILLAERRSLSNLGPISLVVREQPTIAKAIEVLIRYLHLHNESLWLRIERSDGIAIIGPVLRLEGPVPARQGVDLTMGVLYRSLRQFLGPGWSPKSVCFTHPAPRHRASFRRVFGFHIEFGRDFDGVVCALDDLDAPIAAADPALARYAQQYIDENLRAGSGRAEDDLARSVREMVWALLPSGRCSADRIAALLGIDRRTLHRRLARGGLTYSGMVDEVRLEMLGRFIEDSRRPLHALADMLGFSAASAMARWFRGRFGCTVSAWRAAQGFPGVSA